MEQRDCEWCGDSFTPKSKQSRYCYQTHYNDCSYCGSRFELSSLKRPARFCSTSCATKSNLTIRKIEKNCEFCGDTFNAQRSSERFCSKEHYRECVCGNSFLIVSLRRPAKTCSKKCASTLIDFEDRNSKSEQKWIENYGTKNPSQAAEIKQKKKLTTMANYGVDNPSRSKEVKERRRATIQERFGVDNAGQSPVVRAKMKKTNLKRYGVENVFQLPEIQALSKGQQCRQVSKINRLWHKRIQDYIEVSFDFEVRVGKFFADLGKGDLVVEINPTITHNTTVSFPHVLGMCKEENCTLHNTNAADYHQIRALEAEANGKVMLQYFDWYDKDIFMSVLRSKLGMDENQVRSKDCELKEISELKAKKFFMKNHILGETDKQDYCLGLFYNGELVYAQSYRRLSEDNEWEVVRSCSKMNWSITESFYKCHSAFVEEKNPENIVSHVNLSIGGYPEQNLPDWIPVSVNEPQFTWSFLGFGSELGRKVLFVGDTDTSLIPSDDFMTSGGKDWLSEGYVKVFDAGTRTFMWNKP